MTIIIQNNKYFVEERTTKNKLNPNELLQRVVLCVEPKDVMFLGIKPIKQAIRKEYNGVSHSIPYHPQSI